MTCPICYRPIISRHWTGSDRCTCPWEEKWEARKAREKAAREKEEGEKRK